MGLWFFGVKNIYNIYIIYVFETNFSLKESNSCLVQSVLYGMSFFTQPSKLKGLHMYYIVIENNVVNKYTLLFFLYYSVKNDKYHKDLYKE